MARTRWKAIDLKGVLALACFFTVCGGILLQVFVSTELHAIESSKWPKVDGEVVASYVQESAGTRAGIKYTPIIKYRYTVGQVPYVSDTISFPYNGTTQGQAWDKVQMYPPQAKVSVFYEPADPKTSCLEPGEQSTFLACVAMVLMLMLLAVGIGSFVYYFKIRAEYFRQPLPRQ